MTKTVEKTKNIQAAAYGEGHSASRLLKAALVIFSRSGYHGATTKEIANEAGVNEALITRHFKTKQGLFLAVVESNMVKSKILWSPQLCETIEEELIAFSDLVMDSNKDNVDFSKMVLCYAIQNPGFAAVLQSQMGNLGASILKDRLVRIAKHEGLSEFNYEMVEEIVHKIAYTGFLYSVMLGFQGIEASRKGVHQEVRFFWRSVRTSLDVQIKTKRAPHKDTLL